MSIQSCVFYLFLFSATVAYGSPITAADNIQIDLQQPNGSGKLSVAASVFKDRLVLGGAMTRSPEVSILGRIHIVVNNAEGEMIAEKFVTPSPAGRRGENRRQFSADFDFPDQPSNLRISVRYEASR